MRSKERTDNDTTESFFPVGLLQIYTRASYEEVNPRWVSMRQVAERAAMTVLLNLLRSPSPTVAGPTVQ